MMRLGFKILLSFLVVFIRQPLAQAQFFSFSNFNGVGVENEGLSLPNPWSGSYNSGQFWPCDINNDGTDDMLVFDKMSNRVLTYLAVNQSGNMVWQYNSDYEDLIPAMESWMATADFNCDGRKDLFTQTASGIKVFKNVSVSPNQSGFVLAYNGLSSIGFSGIINVQVNPYGAPAITDVDGDGDLDILTFDFTGNTVEYHQNRILQLTGNCAGFDLKKDTCVFGLFATQPTCGQIRMNTGCYGQKPPHGDSEENSTARIAHVGSQLAAMDLDGDGDKDLLVGDLGCPLLNHLTNGGTTNSALITQADTLFPSANSYVKLPVFPSAYLMDVNFDGRSDLLVTPTSFSNAGDNNAIHTKAATQLYLNQSPSSVPDFQWLENDFLQNQSIDLGEESTPVFADLDADGDQDMLVGHRGLKIGNVLQASVYLFRNKGNHTEPNFTLESTDYLGLGALFRQRIKPIFGDINGDGALDFCWISASGGSPDSSKLCYLLNQNTAGTAFSFPDISQRSQLPVSFSAYDSPDFWDIDGDFKMDLLVGKNSGRIQYWRQTSAWPNLQYQLENSNYGNLVQSPFSININLAIGDADQNGQADLVTGDQTGNIKWYRNFLSNGLTNPDSSTFYNTLFEQKVYRVWGPFVSPAVADLNGDGFPELAIGCTGGGISLLVNRMGVNAVKNNRQSNPWKIWPNPLPPAQALNWTGPKPENIVLCNAQGKKIMDWSSVSLKEFEQLPMPKLPKGFYYLQFSDLNQVASMRFVIQ